MSRLHIVSLSDEDEADLRSLLSKHNVEPHDRKHARILLLADTRLSGYLTNAQIGRRVGMSARSVIRVRAAYALDGLEAALSRKPRSDAPRRLLNGAQSAQVLEIAVSPAPDGHAHWTLSTLREEIIARGIVPSISKETVRMTLKRGAVPPGSSAPGRSHRPPTATLSPTWNR